LILQAANDRSRHCRAWCVSFVDVTGGAWCGSADATQPKELTMTRYVDGFVVPVPQAQLAAYRRMARKAGKIWIEHGALEYTECVADDVKPGKLTSFPQAVKLKPDEVVVFAWIVYRSRRERDRINAKVMADPRLKSMMDPKAMLFDGRRMFWGGFKPLVDLGGA
jgi:uncharacterized protein YbaA (DUF1428 family)